MISRLLDGKPGCCIFAGRAMAPGVALCVSESSRAALKPASKGRLKSNSCGSCVEGTISPSSPASATGKKRMLSEQMFLFAGEPRFFSQISDY